MLQCCEAKTVAEIKQNLPYVDVKTIRTTLTEFCTQNTTLCSMATIRLPYRRLPAITFELMPNTTKPCKATKLNG